MESKATGICKAEYQSEGDPEIWRLSSFWVWICAVWEEASKAGKKPKEVNGTISWDHIRLEVVRVPPAMVETLPKTQSIIIAFSEGKINSALDQNLPWSLPSLINLKVNLERIRLVWSNLTALWTKSQNSERNTKQASKWTPKLTT
jgi:hypothetical protein